MKDNRSLAEIHQAISDCIQELYAEKGAELSDNEAKKAADNLLGFCNKVIEIEANKDEVGKNERGCRTFGNSGSLV